MIHLNGHTIGQTSEAFFVSFSRILFNIKGLVLSILHCALQNSAAIFLMLKNPVSLIALCNPFASAMSVIKRLFIFIYWATRAYLNIASLKRPETRDVIISFHATECLPQEKQNPGKQ